MTARQGNSGRMLEKCLRISRRMSRGGVRVRLGIARLRGDVWREVQRLGQR